MQSFLPLLSPGPDANSSSGSIVQLCLVSQSSLAEETVSRNGLQRSVHVVVKNTPFQLVVGFTSSGPLTDPALEAILNFNRLALDVSLLYDCESLKPVSFVKTKPITYKPKIHDNGDQITLQCRLKVLTSQHEDMFFRIKIRALQPVTQQEFDPPLEIISLPIKVVSKPEQLKGRRKKSTTPSRSSSQSNGIGETHSPSNSNESIPVPAANGNGAAASRGKKRSLTDMLVEQVTKLERQTQIHQKLFEKILDTSSPAASRISQELIQSLREFSSDPDDCSVEEPVQKRARVQEVNLNEDEDTPTTTTTTTSGSTSMDGQSSGTNGSQPVEEVAKLQFEQLFVHFLESYNSIKPEDRASTIRRIMRTRTTRETEQLTEFVDLLSSEGLKRTIGSAGPGISSGANGECLCVNCPHRSELEKIDEFYSTFFTS